MVIKIYDSGAVIVFSDGRLIAEVATEALDRVCIDFVVQCLIDSHQFGLVVMQSTALARETTVEAKASIRGQFFGRTTTRHSFGRSVSWS